ncbi:hypothetical protein [uncultured Brevundimonas sp.]|uniref:hypothetical protein n=1 Tax=uncultured Brevundimonas sp. TaxID=213418 RepID=UPI0030ECDB70|tara:strand:+ start:1469 stop:1804 length:336 start_codon:yes stop_codon:yes gene_type:complete
MLSEAELGAAVTYAELQQPEFSFVADHPGPPARRLRLWSEPPGWMFAYTETVAGGEERLGGDYWDETFRAIIRYPDDYAPRGVIWRDERTGEIVDIYSINPEAGQTPCSPT